MCTCPLSHSQTKDNLGVPTPNTTLAMLPHNTSISSKQIKRCKPRKGVKILQNDFSSLSHPPGTSTDYIISTNTSNSQDGHILNNRIRVDRVSTGLVRSVVSRRQNLNKAIGIIHHENPPVSRASHAARPSTGPRAYHDPPRTSYASYSPPSLSNQLWPLSKPPLSSTI